MTEKYEEVLSGIRLEIETLNGGKEMFYKKIMLKLELILMIIKRITRSAIIVEINTNDVKLVKTNISSLHSKR